MDGAHYPVMLHEALEGLSVRPDGIYVDGTFGRGGHSRTILERLGAEGRLLAFDRDPEAVAWARQNMDDPRFEIVHGSFTMLADEVARRGWAGQVAGVLLDLGVSSPQLDARERGFSFLRDGPLDMRMNPGEGISARQWLAEVDQATLAQVLKEYGEERFSGRIARAIKEAVEADGLHTTGELARLVESVVPRREKGKHPATRTFQAIRIAVNGELDALKAVLPQAVDVLRTGGRLVAISFHSLEDRLVKRFIRALSRGERDPFGREVSAPRLKPVGRAVFPSAEEVAENPRSRSAVMRVAERI